MKTSVLAAATVAALTITANAHAGDSKAGEAIFNRTCANCHATQIGVNKIGPSLWAIVDRPVASVPDFNYSEALRSKSKEWGKWDTKRIDAYLVNPREVLHGVKMYFKGLPDEKDRANILAYLKTLSWPDL